jgi:hypothetical protein
MHLLAPVAAGMAGAAGGTVEVYARGTSTPITLYTDFEGTTTTSNPATLDSNGRSKLYVDQYARCVVKNSTGSTVIDFVDGYDANAVEVRSASIIGNAYVGGAAAAGNPISVEAALNKLITSFGTTDFNVLLAGASVAVQTALGYLWRARVFDVKAYGALGDGVTNDLNAINAATLAAHNALGGIVFFPPGTYIISSILSSSDRVEYAGAGASLSTIRASTNSPVFSAGTGAFPRRIRDLNFTTSSLAFVYWIASLAGAPACVVQDCTFDHSSADNGNNGVFRSFGGSELRFIRCTMGMTSRTASALVSAQGAGSSLICEDCTLTQSSSSSSLGYVTGTVAGQAVITLDRCRVIYLSAGGHTNAGILGYDYSTTYVRGCRISPAATAATNTVLTYGSATSCYLFESDNDFSALYALVTTASIALGNPYAVGSPRPTYAVRGSRAVATVAPDSPNGATITLFLSLAALHVIRTTAGAGTRAIVGDSQSHLCVDGETATLAVHNDTGSSVTYQWSTSFASTGSTFAVTANSVRAFSLVYIRERGKWFLVSDSAGAETAE